MGGVGAAGAALKILPKKRNRIPVWDTNKVQDFIYAESSLLNVVYIQDLRIGELLELDVKKSKMFSIFIIFSIFSIFNRI